MGGFRRWFLVCWAGDVVVASMVIGRQRKDGG